MKASDYIIKFIEEQGVKHIFGITGGAAVHLFQSIADNPNIDYVCPQHEQAAAMMADAYSRVTKNLGVAIATSGPGATNLITGICCSHFDSIPTLFITGQVFTGRLKKDRKVRQFGFQETDIVNCVKHITKYAVQILNPDMIKYELQKAVYTAKEGRKGAVLLDIPDDIQRAEIDLDYIPSFKPIPEQDCYPALRDLKKDIEEIVKLILESTRPVVIFGTGINDRKEAIEFARLSNIPILPTWGMIDLLPSDDPLVVGTFGQNASRYGNFALQNADLIISIGSRLDPHHIGSVVGGFGREAKKVIVDIDRGELDKLPFKAYKTIHPIIVGEGFKPINIDSKYFFKKINKLLEDLTVLPNFNDWHITIQKWKKKYPMIYEEESKGDYVNPYFFINELSKYLKEGEKVVADTGESLCVTMNTLKVKANQQIFSDFNNTAMGYALPASIGACFANGKKRVICITGDGGMQMNIQELATIAKHNLPIKIFVFNNRGYNMVKKTQDQWLDSNYEATSADHIGTPNFSSIARSYGISAEDINVNTKISEILTKVFKIQGSYLVNINISPKPQFFITKYGSPLEDMEPLLPWDELKEQMIIEPLRRKNGNKSTEEISKN